MERPQSHNRNPNRILHSDRLRHSQSAMRVTHRLCSEPSRIEQNDLGNVGEIIMRTQPHFIFCIDMDALVEVQWSLLAWRGKPSPKVVSFSDSDLLVKGAISEGLALSIMANMSDPGEKRRGFIVSGLENPKPVLALSHFLSATFPWMEVYSNGEDRV